jgi:hypothetical protein
MRILHHPTSRRAPTVAQAPSLGRRGAGALLLAGVGLFLTACSSSSLSSTTTSTARTGTAPTSPAPTSTSTTAGSSTTSTSSVAKTYGCSTTDLNISLGGPNGTAGAIHYVITFRNTGSSPCSLFGYPGVSFLAADGSQIGSSAQRTSGVGVASVALAPGALAYSGLSVTDPGIPPCSSAGTATQVRVFPPGETHAALAVPPTGIAVCSSPNTPSYRSALIGPLVTSTP